MDKKDIKDIEIQTNDSIVEFAKGRNSKKKLLILILVIIIAIIATGFLAMFVNSLLAEWFTCRDFGMNPAELIY